MGGEREDESAVHEAIDRLVDEYRARCLGFLKEDFYPTGAGPTASSPPQHELP